MRNFLILTYHLVLHPSLRAQWFSNTAPSDNLPAQKEAVSKAEELFRYVATAYFDELQKPVAALTAAADSSASSTSRLTAQVITPSSTTMSDGWLAGILSFNMVQTSVSVAATPRELFEDEVRRYLLFEGGRGTIFDALGWWKVCRPCFI